MPHRLSALEAAARLGVKRETLYAYVSRGLLDREPAEDGRSSTFDNAEVEALAERTRRGGRAGGLEVVVASGLTRIADDRLYFRGLDAGALAGNSPFEAVAEWLWTGDRAVLDGKPPRWPVSQASLAVSSGHAPGLSAADRLRVTVAEAGSADPLRYDVSPAAVAEAGRRIISAMVESLPTCGTGPRSGSSIAARLTPRLGPVRANLRLVEAVNACLVMMADHELAASTFAARVAASVRADPYSVVLTGLGVMAGALHGGASREVVRLYDEIGDDPAAVPVVIGERLRRDELIPGLGHKVYRQSDPRTDVILGHAERLNSPRWPVTLVLRDLVRERVPVLINVDFALGSLVWLAGLDPDAAETMFAIARVAGWLAHAIEEYGEEPLRFRPRAVYVGPAPA